MRRFVTNAGALGGVVFLALTGLAQACDMSWGPGPTPPPWEELVDLADIVFVGRVTATEPETEAGWGRAWFDVETWIKGGVGKRFESAQGAGSNCVMGFTVGSRVIFVGSWLTVSGTPVAIAEDTGWGPLVFLSDPPTAEEVAQLNYLKTRVSRPEAPRK